MKIIIYSCLFLFVFGCENGNRSSECSSLKKEIRELKDSLQNFHDYYYHFRGVKTIAQSRDTIFNINKEYTFNCYMAGYEMISQGNLMNMEITGKSTNGNSLKFEKVNGDIKMHYVPEFSGKDTLKLFYNFHENDTIGWMRFPMNLEVSVLGSGK